MQTDSTERPGTLRQIPRGVWMLSFVSMFMVVLIASDIVLAHGNSWPVVTIGVALWGLHVGLTHGLLATMARPATTLAMSIAIPLTTLRGKT